MTIIMVLRICLTVKIKMTLVMSLIESLLRIKLSIIKCLKAVKDLLSL